MGRLERLRKKRHKKHRKDQGRRPRAVGSDPEPSATPLEVGAEHHLHYGSYTNSCDEILCNNSSHTTSASTCTPGPSYGSYGGQEQVHHHHHHSPPDEMEVTRKLSCLNFSTGGSVLAVSPAAIGSSLGRDMEVLSDVDLGSELASATQLDLLPTLSDKDMEGVELSSRYARKRPSRRKTNRRSKKFHYIGAKDSCASKVSSQPSVSTATLTAMTRTSSRETPSSPHRARGQGSVDSPRLSRTRSLRRLRQQRCKASQEDDPFLCFLSDTSVVPDIDTPTPITVVKGNHDMDGVEIVFEALPPAMEVQQMCDDALPNESELSESTSDRYGL